MEKMALANTWQWCRIWGEFNEHWVKENSFESRFSEYNANRFLDIYTKRSALRASASVVSVISYSGERKIFWGSGFIIECDKVNKTFFSTVLTSASLLRLDASENALVDNIKVDVILAGGKTYGGKIQAYDFHYNIVALNIESDEPLEIARLRHMDDSIMLGPSRHSSLEEKSFQLRPHSRSFKLFPGDRVIALGRFHDEKYEYELMVAPGKFSFDCCPFDCKELFRANCKITKSGIGGPLINCYGEVIGINFYAEKFTPFLPISIFFKWWEHLKKFGEYRRPWLGIDVINLYAAKVHVLEQIKLKFPNIFEGVIVEEVMPGSSVDSNEICPNGVIIQCDGKSVRSVLELFELIWDKAEKPLDLVVLRPSDGTQLNITTTVGDVCQDQFNRWPLPLEFMKWVF